MRRISITLLILVLIAGVGYGAYYYFVGSIKINKIVLKSPDNSALKENIGIFLNRPAKVQIEYWKKGSETVNRTPLSDKKKNHEINLLLLEPNSLYEYKIVVHSYILSNSSNDYHFKTRKQSPWMVHDWIKEHKPHDPNAIGEGLMMITYRGFPGYIAMVDSRGIIRWYWQDKNLGVRLATITPRNTILALLAPAGKDKFHKKEKAEPEGFKNYYMRTGKIGFVGGTEIAEIDLQGNVLWRINIEDKDVIFHHDLRMNSEKQIVSIYRDYKLHDLNNNSVKDTLWGDGIMVMDTTGNILKKWSAWDVWDISKDKRIEELANDRFHFNSVSFDKDGNYLISTPIENQIWKIDKNSGEIVWKLGEGGDFKMDSESNFYFQHAAHINRNGDLMLFDNGDFSPNDTTKVGKLSRVLSFDLDTVNMTATTKIDVDLPSQYYTSRMGSAYLLPNDNILHTSSKTGNVVISNKKGKTLWVLNTSFIPYRVEYVPATLWKNYIQ